MRFILIRMFLSLNFDSCLSDYSQIQSGKLKIFGLKMIFQFELYDRLSRPFILIKRLQFKAIRLLLVIKFFSAIFPK